MPHLNNDPVVNPKFQPLHGDFMPLLVAGGPQLIPGGSMLIDYFKSFPTVFWHENKSFGGYDKNDPDANYSKQIATGTAMWVGGLALMTDILFSGVAEASSALPYIRALICGTAFSSFTDLWDGGTHGKYYEWIPHLFYTDRKELGGLASLLAFMVGFLGTRNNVGGGAWSTGGHIGLATASAMIADPYLFRTGSLSAGYGYLLGSYMRLVFFYALTMGGASRLLSTRVSPTALAVIIGGLNAMLQKKRLQSLVWAWIPGLNEKPVGWPNHPIPPPPHHSYAYY